MRIAGVYMSAAAAIEATARCKSAKYAKRAGAMESRGVAKESRRIMRLALLLIPLGLLYMMLPMTGSAHHRPGQTDPTPSACGMPAGGIVYHANTWTLSANCTQTSFVMLHSQMDNETNKKVVINGSNKSIKVPNNTPFINCAGSSPGTTPKMELEINNVTIDGGGSGSKGSLWIQNCKVTLNNVTMKNTYASAIQGGTGAGAGNRGEFILNNVLFEDLRGFYSYHGSRPSAINAFLSTSWTLNNVVVRDVYGGAFAIGPAWASASDKLIGTAPSFTFTGCYTAERIFVRERHSSVNPGNRPLCTGTIGNQGSAVKTVPHPQPADCGLPSGGFLLRDASYSLSADCALSDTLYIPRGVTISIAGNGRAIVPAQGKRGIAVGGNLTMRNAIVKNATNYPLLVFSTGTLLVENTVFSSNARPVFLKDPTATLRNVLFENHNVASTWRWGNSLLIMVETDVTLRDVTFRNNSNGGSPIRIEWKSLDGIGPKVKLEGCATFSGNTPDVKYTIRSTTVNGTPVPDGDVTDNTGGAACPSYSYPAILDPVAATPVPQPTSQPADPNATAVPILVGGGETATIFRASASGGQPALSLYGVDTQTSQGFHQLTVTQAQVDALGGPGVVATSPDCKVQVSVDEHGNVTAKAGPNYEGKMLHTVFEGSVSGPVISTYTNYEPICAAADTASQQVFSDCMVTTTHALNFRATPNGTVLRVLPYNVTLTAFKRTEGWFYVDYHSERGWISADYVTPVGSCG